MDEEEKICIETAHLRSFEEDLLNSTEMGSQLGGLLDDVLDMAMWCFLSILLIKARISEYVKRDVGAGFH